MNIIFCKNLKSARKLNKLTQKQVASALSVEEYVYANWEQGRAEPSIEFIQNLCVILDVSANELLGIEDITGAKIRITNSFNNNSGHIVVGNGNRIGK